MTTEIHAHRLLMWLTNRTGRDTYELVNVAEFAAAEHLPVQSAQQAAQLLELQGQVTLTVAFGPTIHARLTIRGLQEADRTDAERRDPAARFDYALSQLVAAAAADPAGELRLLSVIGTTVFLGDRLKNDEILRAVRYLHDNALAVASPLSGHQPEALTLTSRGWDCVLSAMKMKVRQFVSEQDTPPPGPTFIQHNYGGGAAAQGMNVTQHVGVPPAQLADLVRRLREVAPRLEPSVRDEFLQDVEILDDPDQAPQDRLSAGQRIRAALAQGGAQVGAAAILAGLGNIATMISG
ncbi:hypothetical protein ACWC4A_51985 [Streptomyces mirabilis]